MKLLLYCVKANPQLSKVSREYCLIKSKDNQNIFEALNGKIVAECDFEIEELAYYGDEYDGDIYTNKTKLDIDEVLEKACLDKSKYLDYVDYGFNGYGYAIHIKNLHIFDEPKELSDYYTFNGIVNDVNNWKPIEKAPQNMMYAYELISELGLSGTNNMQLRKNIVISIRPEWLCKILNGEKTVEVRRKVLKEMLK